MAVSEKKLQANRANAQKSTGPKSKDGKAKVALNATRHGLRSQQIVLPGEDPAAFDQMIATWMDDWKPPTDARRLLVEQAVAHAWRFASRCLKVERDHLIDRGRRRPPGAHDRAAAFPRVEAAIELLPEGPGQGSSRRCWPSARGPWRCSASGTNWPRRRRPTTGPISGPTTAAWSTSSASAARPTRPRWAAWHHGLVAAGRGRTSPSRPPSPPTPRPTRTRPTPWPPSFLGVHRRAGGRAGVVPGRDVRRGGGASRKRGWRVAGGGADDSAAGRAALAVRGVSTAATSAPRSTSSLSSPAASAHRPGRRRRAGGHRDDASRSCERG